MPGKPISFLIIEFIAFLKLLRDQRFLIWSMAKREIETQHIGSLFGIIWTIIHPLMMILIFWFVFDVGFKVKPDKDIPFILWLVTGMSAWLIFADIITNGSNVVIVNNSLIKRTMFQSHILPVVKIIASLVNHCVFLIIILLLLFIYNVNSGFYLIQVPYYLFCTLVLALGWSWILSALSVFLRDIVQVAHVVIQAGFWATPIMWNINMIPQEYHIYLKLNPMFYVVQGYRESILYSTPFWHHPYQTVYFWILALTTLTLGALVFRHFKTQFADVL
jgi:lipopolysaccharide transport system permease protein